jgi:Asp-tRNA(Asn)/Glu-tRNA(Gln) amidotransferase A subunit family amidase
VLIELAEAVRSGRVSAVELVAASLERIERANPDLNAVTLVRPEEALTEAAALDRRGADGPLAGLPLLVKDNTDAAGMVTHFGSRTMTDRPPAERSERTVERMVAAGAIVVGRTNIPEFAFQGYTDNDLFGPTRNPWGLEWSPGGSSGGSGAAIAAAMAPLATGTDGGGSIRTPAAFCGLVGLKPTAGLIGRRPIPSWLETSTQGPLATTVADARLLLEVLRGPAEGDPSAAPTWSYRGGMPGRVIAVSRSRDLGPLPPEVDGPFRAALAGLERDLGLPVEEITPRELFPTNGYGGGESRDDWYVTVTVEELHWLGREWVVANLDRFGAAFRGEMEHALGYTVEDYLAARIRRFGLTPRVPDARRTGLARRRDGASDRARRRRRGLQHRRVQPERPPGAVGPCRHERQRDPVRARDRRPALARRPRARARRRVGARAPLARGRAGLRALRRRLTAAGAPALRRQVSALEPDRRREERRSGDEEQDDRVDGVEPAGDRIG